MVEICPGKESGVGVKALRHEIGTQVTGWSVRHERQPPSLKRQGTSLRLDENLVNWLSIGHGSHIPCLAPPR